MAARRPQVSVVFATHDRARRLRELLDSLERQTLDPGAFEVIVVDDASTDGTGDVLRRALADATLDLCLIHRERSGGPAVARNAGWRRARGELVAFTDDDCVAAPGWLAAGLDAWRADPRAVVQGRTDPRPDELHERGPFSRTLSVHALGPYFQTCNIFYPRSLLERLGGFDELAFTGPGGEDTDLAWKAIALQTPTLFAPDAQVFHAVQRLGPAGTLRLAWRWTETVQLFARHPPLRRLHLQYRVFWKGWHYLLLRALLSTLLPRRLRLVRDWLAWPYLGALLMRPQQEGGGVALIPFWVLHDVVEMAAIVRGAIRYRTPVL